MVLMKVNYYLFRRIALMTFDCPSFQKAKLFSVLHSLLQLSGALRVMLFYLHLLLLKRCWQQLRNLLLGCLSPAPRQENRQEQRCSHGSDQDAFTLLLVPRDRPWGAAVYKTVIVFPSTLLSLPFPSCRNISEVQDVQRNVALLEACEKFEMSVVTVMIQVF